MQDSNALPLVSIVIPIYNAEKYLEKCIESVISQSYRNIEIILVNDGSKDNSGTICDSFSKIDDRITVLHKQNSGVSASRNDGILISKGEYILFFDADDYVEETLVFDSVDDILKNEVDLAIFGFFVENMKEKKTITTITAYYEKTRIVVSQNPQIVASLRNKNLLGYLWNKLYKLNIIKNNNILFDNKTVCEDFNFNLNYFKFCKTIFLLDKPYYHYIKRLNSASETYYKDRFENSKDIYFNYISLCEILGNSQTLIGNAKLYLINDMIICMYDALLHKGANYTLKEKYRYIKMLVDDTVITDILYSSNTLVTGKLTKILISLIKKKRYLLIISICLFYPKLIEIYKIIKNV